ncbi:ABC-2 type transport system permease protein [Algoriphagus sp. 4150]|uniref:ABC transporter permease n=1 Tax=Algoriphagus sp. 4150 TaxID=2817756 RepID=UPI002858FD77|nr:ABC transporter permease [Algoriphagus sp. 4150]MDR7132467.1 ABC-2 type transport system permease protein [Algoriphagus sp. 4150]
MRNRFLGLLKRELGLLRSNSVILAIFFGAPLAYGLLFGLVYQKAKPENLPIWVVDEDNSVLSDKIIEALDDQENLRVSKVLPQGVNSRSAFSEGNIHALVWIPEGFEKGIYRQSAPELVVEVSTANILTANYASRGIQVVLGTLSAGIEIQSLLKKGMPAEMAMVQYEPFKVNYERKFNPSANYLSFLWPGMLATILQQVFLLAMALSFARETEEGTLGGFVSESGGIFNAIGIKSVFFWILGGLVLAMMAGMYAYFQVAIEGSWIQLMSLIAVFIVAVTFMGIFVSILIPSQLKATEILMVIATPSFVLSGFTWPLSEMPQWIQSVAACIPLTHFLEGYRSVAVYGAGGDVLWPSIGGLLTIASVFLLLSILGLRWRISQKN